MNQQKPITLAKKSTPGNDGLTHFLLHASPEEQIRLFTRAAEMANKDQRDLVKRSKKLQAT